MKKHAYSQQNYLLVMLILCGLILAYMSWAIFDGVMGAILFYAMFRSTFLYFTEKKKWRVVPATLFVMFISFIIIVLPFVFLIWMLYGKVVHFQSHPDELGILREKLWPLVEKYVTNKKSLNDMLMSAQSKILSVLSNALNIMSNILLQLAVMYVTLFFMFKDHKILEETVIRYIPLRKYHAERLGVELVNITYSNLLGQGFISFVQGALLAVGFLIFGINDALFWGVICFFICFLPFIGAPLVFVPAGILEISGGNTFGGIGIMIWGLLIVSTVDNVVRFYLSKRIGDVHPLITLLGVVIGIPVFGVFGLVYGPLFISYFILLVRMWRDNYNSR